MFAAMAALPLCFTPVGAQPMPTCSPGQPCRVLSLSTTKLTGAAVSISGDAGVRFGDGSLQNTAAVTAAVPSMAAFGSTPNDNGATFSSSVLTLQPADATHPGGVTTGAQSIAGAKTFSTAIAIGSGGTGQTTAQAAVDALLPAQGSASGKYLTSNGSTSSWSTVTAATSGYGVYASRPAAATAGNQYFCTNCPVASWVDTGSAWAPFFGHMLGVQPKAASNLGTYFTRTSGANPVISDANGSLFLNYAADNLGGNVTHTAGAVESLSSATMHVEGVCVVTVSQTVVGSSFSGCGVVMRESATGKFADFMLATCQNSSSSSCVLLSMEYWASGGSRTSLNTLVGSAALTNGQLFLKLRRSSTNILWEYSVDGTNYYTAQTTATSTVFTTAPDQVGIGVQESASTDTGQANFISYNSGS